MWLVRSAKPQPSVSTRCYFTRDTIDGRDFFLSTPPSSSSHLASLVFFSVLRIWSGLLSASLDTVTHHTTLTMLAIRSLSARQCLRAAPRAATWSVAVRTNHQPPKPYWSANTPFNQNQRFYSTTGDRVAKYEGTKDAKVRLFSAPGSTCGKAAFAAARQCRPMCTRQARRSSHGSWPAQFIHTYIARRATTSSP